MLAYHKTPSLSLRRTAPYHARPWPIPSHPIQQISTPQGQPRTFLSTFNMPLHLTRLHNPHTTSKIKTYDTYKEERTNKKEQNRKERRKGRKRDSNTHPPLPSPQIQQRRFSHTLPRVPRAWQISLLCYTKRHIDNDFGARSDHLIELLSPLHNS